jgi:hypothetical protein
VAAGQHLARSLARPLRVGPPRVGASRPGHRPPERQTLRRTPPRGGNVRRTPRPDLGDLLRTDATGNPRQPARIGTPCVPASRSALPRNQRNLPR